MMTRSIVSVTTRIFRDYPSLTQFIKWLPHIDIPGRKAILTLCRTQANINEPSRTYDRLSGQLQRTFYAYYHPNVESITLHTLLIPLTMFTTSYIFSGLVSMLCRVVPFNKKELEDLVRSSITKEVEAITTPQHDRPILLWQNLFQHPSQPERLPLSPHAQV